MAVRPRVRIASSLSFRIWPDDEVAVFSATTGQTHLLRDDAAALFLACARGETVNPGEHRPTIALLEQARVLTVDGCV